MSSRIERILDLADKLKRDQNNKDKDVKTMAEVKEAARLEEIRLNDENCARLLKETGVVEIFEELQEHFPGSEVLWGCGGARIAFVLSKTIIEDNGNYPSGWSKSYKYLTARWVNVSNLKQHITDTICLDVDGKLLNGSSFFLDLNRAPKSFEPEKNFWDIPKFGLYISDSLVSNKRKLDDLITEKILTIGSDGYKFIIRQSCGYYMD